jgi:hypothetical protein
MVFSNMKLIRKYTRKVMIRDKKSWGGVKNKFIQKSLPPIAYLPVDFELYITQ